MLCQDLVHARPPASPFVATYPVSQLTQHSRLVAHPPDCIVKHRYGTTGPREYRDGNTPLARPKDAATLIVVRVAANPNIDGQTRILSPASCPTNLCSPVAGSTSLISDCRFGADCTAGSSATPKPPKRGDGPQVTRTRAGGIRETFEETGLIIGRRPQAMCYPSPDMASIFSARRGTPARVHGFCCPGNHAGLSTRRFDTRFMIHTTSS